MADWDERLEGEELASDAQWQTAEIRSAKPNWTSFASSKFLSDAYAPYPALPSPPLPPPPRARRGRVEAAARRRTPRLCRAPALCCRWTRSGIATASAGPCAGVTDRAGSLRGMRC